LLKSYAKKKNNNQGKKLYRKNHVKREILQL
jgi:hypothetical protein